MNNTHLSIKFDNEISETEIIFLKTAKSKFCCKFRRKLHFNQTYEQSYLYMQKLQ